MTTYISNTDHYKDLYVESGKVKKPFLALIAQLIRKGVTGAGIGMKGEGKRNFEAGILTDDPAIVEQAINQFDDVWIGKYCKKCKRRDFCHDPINM